MASRSGELSRSNGGTGTSYNMASAASRREFSSQGGSRQGQSVESAEGAEACWQVVDARHGRSGRSWAKLFKQLNKLLDDIYLTCELDCSLGRVAAMVEYLEASAEDFTELLSQLESVVSSSGQKVAWEVRACRRANSRSPRIGSTALISGGGHGSASFNMAQGPCSLGAAAAAASTVAEGSGVDHWQEACAATAGGHGPSPATARASEVLGMRRAASCGGAPLHVTGGGIAGLQLGSAVGVGGGIGGGQGVRPQAFSPGPAPETYGARLPAAGGAAMDGNPWKGKVNWHEFFAPQQQPHVQQHKAPSRSGTPQSAQQFGSGSGAAAGGAAAAGCGSNRIGSVGGGGGFRLGALPPPPRLKTSVASGGGCSSAGGGWGSIEGACSPSGGPPSPLDSLYHKMLSSPSRKLSPSEVRRASEERQARAEKARQAMVEEKLARLAQANQSRQTVKSLLEERAGAIAARVDSKIARSAELRQAHLAERVQKAVEETKKVAEVAFINQMLEQDKKLALQEKLEEGESRRRQALEALQQRGKGAAAAVEEAQERRKLLQAERLEQLADRQRRKMAAQAKLEEDRRAAAAAREAASRAQRAAAVLAAEARQRQRDVLSVRIEERLREAAARRAQHLELIKERAALGKDLYDRRTMDGQTTSPRSPQSRYTRPPSPEVASAGAGGQQLPPSPLLGRPVTPPGGGAGAQRSGLSAASAAMGAGAGSASAAAGTGASGMAPSSPSGLHTSSSYTTFTPDGGGGSCPSPMRSTDRAITISCDPRRRLKGMRRRACKTLKRLEAARPDFSEPPHLQALLEGADGRELVAAWATLVEAALRDTAAAAADSAATSKASARGRCGSGSAVAASASAGASAVASAADSTGAAPAATAGGGNGNAGISGGGKASAAGSSSGAASSGTTGGAAGPQVAAAAASVKHLLQRVHTDLGGRRKGIALHAARQSGLLAALAELLTAPAAAAASHPPQTSVQLMELLALLVTSSPYNAAWMLARCGAGPLAGLVQCAMRALDRYNGLAADEVWEEPPEARYLAALLQTLACLCRTPFADQPSLNAQQEELVAFVVARGLIHKSTELFSLFDQPAANDTAPIPGYVLQCLALLDAITGGPRRRSPAAGLTSHKRWLPQAANGAAIALAFQETSMAGLPSLLTAVLLRAAPSCTTAEARPERLPPNFVDAAACVMRVLNNIARLDLVAAQSSLGASDLRVVFFHLVGFLLSYCTNQWPASTGVESAIRAALSAAAAGHTGSGIGGHTGSGTGTLGALAAAAAASGSPSQPGGPNARPATSSGGGARGSPAGSGLTAAPPAHTGLVQLLNEVLLLIGFYGVLQPANQDVLLWGKSPTILQRLAEVPLPYFVEQPLYQVLMPTLLSVCYGSERACATLAQHLDLHLLRNYVQAMIRHYQSSYLAATSDEEDNQREAQTQGQGHGSTGETGVTAAIADGHGANELSSSSSSSSSHIAALPAAAEPSASDPLFSKRQQLQDLPITTAPGALTCDSGGHTTRELGGVRSAGTESTAGAGSASSTVGPAGDDACELPPPTADRYSLAQRFPPELLPQVLAFVECQMPGAAEHAGSAESSLAVAVAAAAAAGRLTAAAAPPPLPLSPSPLAMLSGEGRGKRAAARKGASWPTLGAGAGAGRTDDALVVPGDAAPGANAAAAVPAAVKPVEAPGAADAAAAAAGTPAAAVGAVDQGAETSHSRGGPQSGDGPWSTPIPISKVVGPAAHASAGGAVMNSTQPSVSGGGAAAGAGGGGGGAATGSSGRAGSSTGSVGYSSHVRRFLDAADVPVPFAAGAIRRQRLLEAAAAAAVAEAAAGGGGGGSGSLDTNNCARSYVSELSFGGYLTPSLQGDSRDGDPRSPGEVERMVLDEFDLEQYEQLRLDEQQHLDEQDVLLLDEPSVDGGVSGRRKASLSSLAVTATSRKLAGSLGGAGGCEEPGADSPPDLGAGLLAVKKAKGHVDLGQEEFKTSAAVHQLGAYDTSTGVVLDAWWRRIGYEFGGEGDSSDSESGPDDGDEEGRMSERDSPPLSEMMS